MQRLPMTHIEPDANREEIAEFVVFSKVDGAHHKVGIIDQVLIWATMCTPDELPPDELIALIGTHVEGTEYFKPLLDDPSDGYIWDTGIAP